jgi:predicted dehydrogenase
MKDIKWGILGTSFISEVMANAIQESDTGELVAIGSRSSATAEKFADTFSIPKFYDDYHALINDKEIDAIYIGLPNHLHKEWITHAAEAGKHILCEKPFVLSVKEMQEVISVIQKNNVFCMEALMYRYHPLTKKLCDIINNKIIGDIKLYNATYTANIAEIANPTAGGGIRNLGCYPVSLVRLLANAEPIEIHSTGRMNYKNHTDNQASAILKFKNDSMAVISIADDIEMFWQFDIYGTEGCLKVITNPWLPDVNNKIIIQKSNDSIPQEIDVTAEKPLYTYQIDTLGKCINTGNTDGVSLSDSLGNVLVLETWLRQVKIQNLQPELITSSTEPQPLGSVTG